MIEEIIDLITRCYQSQAKVIIFGNGGSMADAMHFAEELTGRYQQERPPLAALALSDPAHLSCVANDYSYDEVFARGVEAFAKANDVVIGLSTSGNSENVIKAISKAQELGCFTVSFLGKDGGKLCGECDYEILIPSDNTARIQEMHMLILHIIIEGVEKQLFEGL
ncbi:MAG TPA: SIS domain-containing protein [Candidatus Cloacimonadota bacterium]|nr:SIS domain-containing protein [Candidatus Cloacimonadota bacterium]